MSARKSPAPTRQIVRPAAPRGSMALNTQRGESPVPHPIASDFAAISATSDTRSTNDLHTRPLPRRTPADNYQEARVASRPLSNRVSLKQQMYNTDDTSDYNTTEGN